MKLGLISDTHDNLPKINKAVEIFNKCKVNFVLHAGDFIAPFSIAPFLKLNCEWIGVFGNNDGEKKGLIQKSGKRIQAGPISLRFDNRRITVIHNLENYRQGKEEIILFGHTHKPEIKKIGRKLFVNPGECSGWLFNRSTIAILNLKTTEVKIIDLE